MAVKMASDLHEWHINLHLRIKGFRTTPLSSQSQRSVYRPRTLSAIRSRPQFQLLTAAWREKRETRTQAGPSAVLLSSMFPSVVGRRERHKRERAWPHTSTLTHTHTHTHTHDLARPTSHLIARSCSRPFTQTLAWTAGMILQASKTAARLLLAHRPPGQQA